MPISQLQKIYLLSRTEVFKDLSSEVLAPLADEAEELVLIRGRNLLQEGMAVEALYMVLYGAMDVLLQTRKVATVGPQSILGDQEILSDELQAKNTVKVSSDFARLMRIPRARFLETVNGEPRLIYAFMRALARRTENMRDVIAEGQNLTNRIQETTRLLESSLDSIRSLALADQKLSSSIVEMRFLVQVDEDRLSAPKPRHLEQAYIAIREREEIRVRNDDGRRSITAKRDYGKRSAEIELDLDEVLYTALFEFGVRRSISKKRYTIEHEGHLWDIDVFDDESKCAGLMLAEVKVSEGEEIPPPPPGVIIIRDVTGDERYRNRSLSQDGPPVREGAWRIG